MIGLPPIGVDVGQDSQHSCRRRGDFRLKCFGLWLALALSACSEGGENSGVEGANQPSGAGNVDAGGAQADASASPHSSDSGGNQQTSPGGNDAGNASETGSGAQPVDAAEPVITGSVTYFQNVKPFVDAKCVRCHVEGTVAPFALDSYELLKEKASFAQAAISSGSMPPWQFADGCNDYVGNFSLTPEEKALFRTWVEQGAPRGDETHPAPKLDIGEVGLSRVDVRMQMPEVYTPKNQTDEYRCFPVAWPSKYTTTSYMTGFKAVPGNPRIVHHVEVYHVKAAQAQQAFDKDTADEGPGYGCFGGPGLGEGTVGGWAPGSPGYDYPTNVGIAIEAGSVMVVQVHYNMQTTGKPEPDQSAVEFKVDAQAIAGGYDFWTNTSWTLGNMRIAANNPDVAFNWTADPTTLNGGSPLGGGKSIMIHTASIHMHNLGTTGYMKLKRKDGSSQCLLQLRDWDFHWQGGVRLKKPVLVQPGDTIEMECRYDNSAANQPVFQGQQQMPRDVNWGENSTDEMCLGILLWGQP
jgi:hypothetical protein